MAKLELTRDKVVNQVNLKSFQLAQFLLDNKVTEGKAKMTELKALVDELNTAIQAASNFYSLD